MAHQLWFGVQEESFWPHELEATLTNPLDLEVEEAMGTFSGQLGSDVSVTPVPLAAFHRLAR